MALTLALALVPFSRIIFLFSALSCQAPRALPRSKKSVSQAVRIDPATVFEKKAASVRTRARTVVAV